MRVGCLAVLTLGLLAACAPAHVVTTPAPMPVAGDRIRYAGVSDTGEFIDARMVSVNADSLVFERFVSGWNNGPGLWARGSIPTDSIGGFQVHIGRRANAGRGALIGTLVGGAIGVACAATTREGWFQPTPEQCVFAYTLTGAGTGLLIGALSRSDVWAPTALPRRRPPPPIAGAPLPAGAALAIGFSIEL
jgi:hypothetical protein